MIDLPASSRRAMDALRLYVMRASGDWKDIPSEIFSGSHHAIVLIYVTLCIAYCYIARKHRRSDIRHADFCLILALFVLTGGIIDVIDVLAVRSGLRSLVNIKTYSALVTLASSLILVRLIPRARVVRDASLLEREITQRRKTELELRQVHAQLEGVIEQRTAELAAKTEEMEQFLNTVSHDLKNPVVTCLGLISMLREDAQAGRVQETLDSVARMERSVTRMRQLIDDLLNLSRIGRVRFELQETDTLSMIREIGEDIQPRLNKIGAILEIQANLPVVMADSRWLSEVFENLITNAIKYGCDNPRPRITVGCIPERGVHRMFVRDNGHGVDSAHHAQIFEPFRRLQSDKEGNGMGLAIVRRIVTMHGGRVFIESMPGHGATFWVELPTTATGPSTDVVNRPPHKEMISSLSGVFHEA